MEVGRRVVESEVAVRADAAADDINGRRSQSVCLFGRGCFGIGAGFEQVDGGEGKAVEDGAAQP